MATPNMGITQPVDHGSADLWGQILNTALDTIDAHDHTTGKGVKVPAAGLRINADVPWSDAGTPYAITGAKAVDFAAVASTAVTGYALAFFVSDGTGGLAANELYWRTSGGTNVRVTSGAALNVAAFVGGIGGDYSAVGALVDYDDASDTYRFRQEQAASVRQYGKVSHGDLRLFEYRAAPNPTVPTNAVTLKSPAALAASYDVTWPTAVPGAAAFLQMSTAGVLSATNTLVGSNLTAPDFRHTAAQTLLVHGSAAQVGNGVGHARINSGGYSPGFTTAATSARIQWPIQVKPGDVITGYTVYCRKISTSATTLFTSLTRTQGSTGTSIGQSAGASNAANNPGYITISETGQSITVTTGGAYFVELSPVGGGGPDETYHVEVTYTRP